MNEFSRNEPRFALCGLNCCLCPRFHTEGASRCPGCGGPGFVDKHPTCAVATCNRKHDGVEFCFQCGAYPCKKYTEPPSTDSFISYREVGRDLLAAQRDLPAYLKELSRREAALLLLLRDYDEGRSKGLYCLAVNLLPLDQLESLMTGIQADGELPALDLKERARRVAALFRRRAEELHIDLALRK